MCDLKTVKYEGTLEVCDLLDYFVPLQYSVGNLFQPDYSQQNLGPGPIHRQDTANLMNTGVINHIEKRA